MEFNFDLGLVQSQKILLTPQLKQALEILKMNSQELFEYVEEELEANPVLEIEDAENSGDEDEAGFVDEQAEWNDMVYHSRNKIQDEEGVDDVIDLAADKSTVRLSLKEHLLFQLHVTELDEKRTVIGEYLIDNIDENGYLTVDLSEVASFFNTPVMRVRRVLDLLQTFDPPGICARNLKECLLIQLKHMNNFDTDTVEIIQNYLDELGANKISAIAKKSGLNVQRVTDIFNFIKTLEPKPGRAFYSGNEIKFLIPDVIVKKVKDRFDVLINEDSIPLLCINKYYRKIASEDINSESKKFIQCKMDNAAWLIKCIEQRKDTLRKITETIVKKQQDFFEAGKSCIKPLTMKEVAREVNMHESTISRAVSGKYIQCAWGTFEIRYFFTGKMSGSAGEEISAESIKVKLKHLVDSEDKTKPLNDSEITDALTKQGIQISRRTVAKYRTQLGIAEAAKRKKY